MRKKFTPVDFSINKTYSLNERKNKVSKELLALPYDASGIMSAFWDSIPSILGGKDLKSVVDAIAYAYKNGKTVIWSMGAHVIKVGLSPVLIDLMRKGIISAFAMNGACAVHETELAIFGETSEDVGEGIKNGNFGMVKETGSFINEVVFEAAKNKTGFGEELGRRLLKEPNAQNSLIAQCYKEGVPVTIHVAIGNDIFNIHPDSDGAKLGEASFYDFRLFAGVMSTLTQGGVIVNSGSAVIMPNIIEKALSVVRNQGFKVEGFTGVNLDFIKHYRALNNPVARARELGGEGYMIVGHHEILIPLIAAGVLDKIK